MTRVPLDSVAHQQALPSGPSVTWADSGKPGLCLACVHKMYGAAICIMRFGTIQHLAMPRALF
jgi:hypothetical protein